MDVQLNVVKDIAICQAVSARWSWLGVVQIIGGIHRQHRTTYRWWDGHDQEYDVRRSLGIIRVSRRVGEAES